MLTVSVTNLQTYRRYRESEAMPLSVLMMILKRQEPPSAALLAGHALHTLLEKFSAAGLEASLQDATVEGHTFRFTLDGEVAIPPLCELRGQRDYLINGEVVTVKARVDGLEGNAIREYKLRTGNFKAEKYAESYQWRFYLSIFGAESVTYNVFTGDAVKEGEGDEERTVWEIDDFHPITFYRYPELEDDITRELGLYAEFARQHLEAA